MGCFELASTAPSKNEHVAHVLYELRSNLPRNKRMLREVYSVEVVGGFLSSDRLFFILLLAQALKNLLAIGKLIVFLPTKMGEEP